MKSNTLYKYLLSIFILFSAAIFSSCTIDADTSNSLKTTTANPFSGMYKTRGSMYNYSGQTSLWSGPPISLSLTDSLSVPSGFISRIDLSVFSPKKATAVDSVSITIPFANYLSADYYYHWRMNVTYTSIASNLSPVMLTGFSKINESIRAFTPPLPTQKLSMRVITHYNDQPGGLGNDHIVDEVFEQQ